MSVSDADIAFAKELFSALGTITHRKMMGGATFYCDGAIFSIVDSEGMIFLRAKGGFADELEAAGARKFTFIRKKDGREGSMAYWTLPDSALDDPDAACDWAGKALNQPD